jgi:hypothetical protein
MSVPPNDYFVHPVYASSAVLMGKEPLCMFFLSYNWKFVEKSLQLSSGGKKSAVNLSHHCFMTADVFSARFSYSAKIYFILAQKACFIKELFLLQSGITR